MKRLLLICMLMALLIAATFTGSASARHAGWLDPGGVEWNCDYKTQVCAIGTHSVHVWHNGWHPEGFLNYRWNMWVDFTVGKDCTYCFNGRPKVNAGTSNERFVDGAVVLVAKSYYYGCTVAGVWRNKGCFYAYRKARVHVETIGVGGSNTSIPAYPWVKVWIRADGDVIRWDYSRGML
jgi:hypothetical protein